MNSQRFAMGQTRIPLQNEREKIVNVLVTNVCYSSIYAMMISTIQNECNDSNDDLLRKAFQSRCFYGRLAFSESVIMEQWLWGMAQGKSSGGDCFGPPM